MGKKVKLFEDFVEGENKHMEKMNKDLVWKDLDVDDVYNIYDTTNNGKIVHQWAIYMGEKDGKLQFKSANLPKADPYLIDKDEKYHFIKKSMKKK